MSVIDLIELLQAAPHAARVYVGAKDGDHAELIRALVLDDDQNPDSTQAVYVSTT